MLKILLLLSVVIVALVAWRLAARPRRAPPPPASPPPQRMVRCAECAVHLPEADALQSEGLHFCDERHRAAYQRRQRGD